MAEQHPHMHPECRWCQESERINVGLALANRQLKEALSEDYSKWSVDVLLAVGDALLEEIYPAGVPLISEGEDPGPRLVRALRDCREAMSAEHEALNRGAK